MNAIIAYATAGRNKGFKLNDETKFPCNAWWIARCDPHPGHNHPVSERIGHRGKG